MDLTQLLPQFGNVAFTIAAFVVALSIIVAIHEYGHYIVGRWTGIHAEVFSLGFGPVLWARTDRRGTRWQIAALPFGGFVKFLGDANAASVGATDVAEADRRRTMLGAPLWARALTVLAGPVFNFILAMLVFLGVILSQGIHHDPMKIESIYSMPSTLSHEFLVGDEILAVNGTPTPTLESLYTITPTLPVDRSIAYTVRRDGQELTVDGPHPQPPIVIVLTPNSAATDAGLKIKDVITLVDGLPVYSFDQLVQLVDASDGQALLLTIWREGNLLEFTLIPRMMDIPNEVGEFESSLKLGIGSGLVFQFQTATPDFLTALQISFDQVWRIIIGSLNALYSMVAGKISHCNLSGPVAIAQVSGQMASQGAVDFIWFVGAISVGIGFMNLFPIPVLDGGHLVFHAYEAVTGRKPGDKALQILMIAGLSLVLFMTLFALANDLFLCP